jgi:glycerophosphoryl diester phosphodiesterase
MLKKYYDKNKAPPLSVSKMVIYMSDEKNICGAGLMDKLRAIVSIYKLCKEQNIDFKINYIFPFNLSDYLVPNTYDWTISENEISFNSRYAKGYYYSQLEEKSSFFLFSHWLNKIKKYTQLHFYTNASFMDKEYHFLIKELFKPTNELQQLIDYHVNQIGTDFITMAFRFWGMLDSIKSKYYKKRELSETGKVKLIDRCLEHLQELYQKNGGKKVFVATDSQVFLERIQKISYVYVIPGEIKTSNLANISHEELLKTFLDYYLMTYSKKVISVKDGDMWLSGFHMHAALHNNVPYEIKEY